MQNINRVLSSILAAPLLLLVFYQGGWLATIVVACAAIIALFELKYVCISAGYSPVIPISLLLTVTLIISAHFGIESIEGVIFLCIITSILWLSWERSSLPGTPLVDWSLTIIIGIYAGGLMRYGILLRNLDNGWLWVLLVLLGTWSCDTSAYLIGRSFGTHAFSPRWSPSKTWEGAIGGTIISFLVITVVARAFNTDALYYVPLGILIPLAVQLGDLTASMMKRSAGIKDFGNLIPGHGGLLDRIDGLVFSVTVAYFLVKYLTTL